MEVMSLIVSFWPLIWLFLFFCSVLLLVESKACLVDITGRNSVTMNVIIEALWIKMNFDLVDTMMLFLLLFDPHRVSCDDANCRASKKHTCFSLQILQSRHHDGQEH